MGDVTPATLNDVCVLLAEVRDLLHQQSRPTAELIGRDEFAAMIGAGVSTFDRLRAANKIGPRAAELGGVKWHRIEVLAWLAHRDPAGGLYDAKDWPAVWASLASRAKSR